MLFFGTSLLIFWLLNGGAYAKEIRYRLFLNSPFASPDLTSGDILSFAEKGSSKRKTDEKENLPMRIVIPKIQVDAPIITPKRDTVGDILASLEEGVGIYPGSVMPGDEGRTVILGHSSRATWYRGDYATVFALLSKLEAGDQFFVFSGNTQYTYKVFSKKILTPQETNGILARQTSQSEINLITCYPIGSASKRTLIQANLISY